MDDPGTAEAVTRTVGVEVIYSPAVKAWVFAIGFLAVQPAYRRKLLGWCLTAIRINLPVERAGIMKQSIYEAAGGQQAIIALAHAWHARCLADPVVSHAFSHGFHPEHSERLAAYWAEALGGPAKFTGIIGDETTVVRMHSGNGEHVDMDERAETCFVQALDDAGLPEEPALRSALKAYFHDAIGIMSRYPCSAGDVPANLVMRHWSWDGPVAVCRET